MENVPVVSAAALSDSPGWLLTLLSILGVIGAGLQFTALVPRVWGFFKMNSVGDYPFVPILSIALQCFVWSAYGYLIRDFSVFGLNAYGCFLGCFYCLIYFRTMPAQRQKIFLISLCSVLVIVIAGFCVSMIPSIIDLGYDKDIIGKMAMAGSIALFAAPLVAMGQVIRARSCASMSLPLLLAALLSSHSWFFYGLLKPDLNIWLPNGIGSGLNWIQAILFAVFLPMDIKRKRAMKKLSEQNPTSPVSSPDEDSSLIHNQAPSPTPERAV
ncbi:putative solute carrier family 50 (sugar transporter) [Paratrimastix pyriformis]|uniref:Solute carrier family 50 (Sugar transporter) n=1 Tax=Paratrimastix pyriformis TaxID=342808 RepID=A0ABQ8UBM5_9EUKA|nr:putative solute carrier family 50 (sugar transporter) [Paratrimastix pyriformis]